VNRQAPATGLAWGGLVPGCRLDPLELPQRQPTTLQSPQKALKRTAEGLAGFTREPAPDARESNRHNKNDESSVCIHALLDPSRKVRRLAGDV
jgi:hypothetical protein